MPLSTTFTSVSVGETAVLEIVHRTAPPGGTTTCAPMTTPPWHSQVPGVKPLGPSSDRSYGPEKTATALTPPGVVGSPLPLTGPWPAMPTGVAVNVQSEGTRPEPEAAGSTTFTSVSLAAWSLLLIVHVAVSPGPSVTVAAAGSVDVAPVQDQSEAV